MPPGILTAAIRGYRRLGRETPSKDPGRTEWIDGLRGLSSLAVCLSHLVGGIHPDLYFAYGDGISHSKSWLKLPVVRLLHSGDAAVALFFVISGYAISVRPLQQLYHHERAYLFSGLASSAFRRTGRLLLPAMAASLATMLAAQIGAFENKHPLGMFFFVSARRSESFLDQILLWTGEMSSLFKRNPHDLGVPDLLYGTQLWTIPVELSASFVLYLYLLGLTPLRAIPRLAIAGLSTCYFMAIARWDLFLFLAGMILAELTHRDEALVKRELPQSENLVDPTARNNYVAGLRAYLKPATWLILLLIGLCLASEPTINAAEAPGWKAMNQFVPVSFAEEQVGRFWVAIGAVIIFASIQRLWPLRQILGLPLIQYLGEVSFSLYLMHNAVMSSLGAWLISLMPQPMETQGADHPRTGEEWDMVVLAIVALVLLVVFGVSHLFHSLVDQPSIRIMKGLESRLRDLDQETALGSIAH